MRVMLDDKYGIGSDENNFVLFEVKVKGKDSKDVGGVYDVTIGYYGNLEQALQGYVRNSLRKDNDINHLKELVNAIDKLNKTIKDIRI